MIDATAFTEEELQFINWLKAPAVMNKRNARKLIDELEETIVELRENAHGQNVHRKNLLYMQIENRTTQIKWANTFL